VGRWRWRASVVARGVGFVQIDVADMAVFVVTEVLAMVLGVGSGQGGYADRFGQFPTTCGSQLGGWAGALSTSLTSYFHITSLTELPANLGSFLRLAGVCVAGSGRSSHRRCVSGGR
jgi:hypothetical protein